MIALFDADRAARRRAAGGCCVVQRCCAEGFEIEKGPQRGDISGEILPFVERGIEREERHLVLALSEL